jgi:hypothetical protein
MMVVLVPRRIVKSTESKIGLLTPYSKDTLSKDTILSAFAIRTYYTIKNKV